MMQNKITSILGAVVMFFGVWMIGIEVARYTASQYYEFNFMWSIIGLLIVVGFVLLRAKDDWILRIFGKGNINDSK